MQFTKHLPTSFRLLCVLFRVTRYFHYRKLLQSLQWHDAFCGDRSYRNLIIISCIFQKLDLCHGNTNSTLNKLDPWIHRLQQIIFCQQYYFFITRSLSFVSYFMRDWIVFVVWLQLSRLSHSQVRLCHFQCDYSPCSRKDSLPMG